MNQLTINKVKGLLRLSIPTEICFESGYRNIANFNRQFKEITGLSPREYRKAYG
ncbi:MAG: AraC family transcriptional regulator [Bacteroidales bacterium]|nr:AraC family transcriptional regulator [Bacteroidales bacterium]MBS3775361.1 AraC family transcriptional regulator [Bacteroidales bacterium]